MKRTERHHLKEDEMVHGLSWFVHFYESFKKEIMIALSVLGFAALIFGALLLVRYHGQNVRSRSVGEILALSQDLEKKPENVAKLEKLAEDGPSGRLAYLELASYWAGKGETAKAETLLGRIRPVPKDLLYYQAEELKAQVLIKKKDFDGAIAIYKKIQGDNPKSYPADAILFHLAEAYEAKGAKPEALDLYQTLQKNYTQSYYGYEASLKVSRLGLSK